MHVKYSILSKFVNFS